MADTPTPPKPELPDVERWIGDRMNDETLPDHMRIEEVLDDDEYIERPMSDDDIDFNAVDDDGEEVEVVEVVVRVLRKRQPHNN